MTIDVRPTAAVAITGRTPEFLDAACVGANPADFFPESGEWYVAELAKQICHGCPERLACFEWALDNLEWGIWGGTTDRERTAIRAGRPLPGCVSCGEPVVYVAATGVAPRRCPKCLGLS